jgi:hypothetical protein
MRDRPGFLSCTIEIENQCPETVKKTREKEHEKIMVA